MTERHLKVATLPPEVFRQHVNTVLSWGKPKRRSKLQSKLSVTPRKINMEPDNTPRRGTSSEPRPIIEAVKHFNLRGCIGSIIFRKTCWRNKTSLLGVQAFFLSLLSTALGRAINKNDSRGIHVLFSMAYLEDHPMTRKWLTTMTIVFVP